MSDNKKYYYLKLKDNFFDSDSLIVLETMPDGHLYSNILLKLYLRSLKNEGKLMFNERIPYNSTILAQITRHSVGVIEKAMELFRELDLIEILDNGAIYMLDIQNFIGESSTEADRKRIYRSKIQAEKEGKLELTGQMSGQTSDKSPPEIETEIELKIETEIELKIETEIEDKTPAAPYKKIKDLFNNTCKSLSQIRSLSEKRKTHLKARWKQFNCDIEVFKEAFSKVENSQFCKGKNDRGWKVDFDWLIQNDNNILKVLEGKYDDSLGGKADGKSSGNNTSNGQGSSKESDEFFKKAKERGWLDITEEELECDF